MKNAFFYLALMTLSVQPLSGQLLASGHFRPPPPDRFDSRRDRGRTEWTACVFNQTNRARPVEVVWHGERRIKERCTENLTIEPGRPAVFRCSFRFSTPRVQLIAYGIRSGRVRLNKWIEAGVRDGRRQCGRSNSATIVRYGRGLEIEPGKPHRSRRDRFAERHNDNRHRNNHSRQERLSTEEKILQKILEIPLRN